MKNKRAPLSFSVQPVAPAPVGDSKPANNETSLPANNQTSKRPKKKTGPDRKRGQFIAAHVTPEAAKQFKLLAVQHDKMVMELLSEAINDLFAKYGLSRIA